MPQTKYCRGRIRPAAAVLAALPMFGASAVAQALPPPPTQVILTEAEAGPTYAGTLGNTTAGNCTLAGVLRLMQGWTARTATTPLQFTDEQGLADYTIATGYNPATGQPDPGCVETDILDYWCKAGWNGNKLAGYSSVDPTNIEHIRQTIATYGAAYAGLNLPASAEEQTQQGQPWTVPWFFPRILGGHCVVFFEYDEYYVYAGTWGVRQPIAWDFVPRFFDAMYAPADPLWLLPTGLTPGGLGMDALTADLSAVAN